MRIPFEFYELLRSRIKLSDVVRQKISLIKKAGEYVGLCPFHQEKTPSFTVNDSKRFYHCFGCSAHGDVIRFTSNLSGLSYNDSAIKLANDFGIEIPKLTKEQERIYEESDQISNILSLAVEFFKSELNAEVINYLNSRGINKAIIDEFEIGYAKSGKLLKYFEKKSIPLMNIAKAGLVGKREDGSIYEIFHNRIMFPIRNIYSKVIGFGGRVIGDALPKYLNSPETLVFKKNETLYGEHKAIAAARKKNSAILVEGYLDVIALYKAGFEEVVASLGTAVTEGHLNKLWQSVDEIIICLDSDNAGLKATLRVINTALPLIANNRRLSFILLPASSDPDDVVNKLGADYFERLKKNRISLSEMIWRNEFALQNYNTAELRALLESKLGEICGKINDRILQKNYRQYFKDQIWHNINSKKKLDQSVGNNSNSMLFMQSKYSDLEMLEYALCSLAIKFPEIIKQEEIKDEFFKIDFKKKELADLRDWIIEQVITDENITGKSIKYLIENTGFINTYSILSKPDNLFLDASNFLKNFIPGEIWEFLYKKYYLELLKNEYAAIIQNGSEEAFRKASSYMGEIVKLSKELTKLNESFTKL